jgi:hypothetical protein
MAEAWHIARSTRTCAGTGDPIPAGEAFFSALVETEETFERRDFSPAAWPETDKAPFFSYWKNKGGEVKEEKKRSVDYDRLLAFYDNLETAEDPQKRLFRYVLALILVRRRKLRLENMEKTATGDKLTVYDRRREATVEITAPEAAREEFAAVQSKLNELFECDVEA